MHELSVTQSLFDLTLREAAKAGARRVAGLEVRVGALTGIVPDSVAFYFDLLGKGTIAEGAALRFEKVMPVARCRACGAETPLADSGDDAPFAYAWLRAFGEMTCPACGGDDFELVGGHEFALVSIDVE
ncbi:MAG: hydrogenase maturation nickel metallochaperone HypA [Anaerolineae bacterium]|nr:hydrogenase maturation nickel metallochaperone HypA [Anaerolineae bacterium]